jgi:hypothetical protein
MHKFARVDQNHASIIKLWRKCGATVLDCSGARGLGFDAIVLTRGRLYLVEIKDGSLPPSRRALTDAEARARDAFPDHWRLVESEADALALISAAL